jgi:hypothetical protein
LLSASKPKCNFGHWSKITLKLSLYLLPKFSRVPFTIIQLKSRISTVVNGSLGWGSGSRNTENTGKYLSSIVLNTENVQYRNFNTIEYRKFSIPKFQYYWIPKKFQYWSSIVPKFSVLFSMYRRYLNVLHFQQKSPKKFIFPKLFEIFSEIFQYFLYMFGILRYSTVLIPKIPNFGTKIKCWIKNQKFFRVFYRKCSTFRYFRYFVKTENFSNTVQYYWILKVFNTEISILLNTEDGQYRIFNTIEYRKKLQSRTLIIPKIIFNISPHPKYEPEI